MKKTIYILQPVAEEEVMVSVFDDAATRLQKTFPEDELIFEGIKQEQTEDKHIALMALREFIEVNLTSDEPIFFLAGDFTNDNFCMCVATVCKLYGIPCLLDKKRIEEDNKNAADTTGNE